MNPKISVIIPIYNAEKYLSDTLESVLSQSFTGFEVIAVNDGSTDGSLGLLKIYAERDSRIRIIDKPNTGVSDTRNVAIKAAKGEYLAFLDADDVYAENYLKRMYGVAEERDADIVVCSYLTFRGNVPSFSRGDRAEAKPVAVRELLNTGLMTPLWAKLIKKSVVTKNKIAFDTNLAFGEDLFFSWKACLVSSGTVMIEDKLYGYRMSADGATSRYHDRLYEKYKSAFDDLKAYANKQGAKEERLHEMDIYFVKRLPTLSFMCARAKEKRAAKSEVIAKILNDETVRRVTESDLEELTKGESRRGVALYRAAAEKNVKKVLLYGIRLNRRLKLSRLKQKIRGKNK